MLHSGHVAFFKESASYGDVYVGLGSDETVFNLKGRYPVNNQNERKYMIDALACVKECLINTGSGIMDFIKEIDIVKPDIFVVNEDGNTPAKEELSKKFGIEYLVLKRLPFENLPVRSSTALREELTMPYRLDLAGGWLDQPYVGKIASGPVLTISIEPTIEFNERSGMATSTEEKQLNYGTSTFHPVTKRSWQKFSLVMKTRRGQKSYPVLRTQSELLCHALINLITMEDFGR